MSRLLSLFALLLALTGCADVDEPSSIVYITVPGWKSVYRIQHGSDGFVGPAHPKDFTFKIDADGTVTVEGQPWTGHICSVPVVYTDGSKCHEIVWDNPTDDPDIDLANELGWKMCDLNGYVVPVE